MRGRKVRARRLRIERRQRSSDITLGVFPSQERRSGSANPGQKLCWIPCFGPLCVSEDHSFVGGKLLLRWHVGSDGQPCVDRADVNSTAPSVERGIGSELVTVPASLLEAVEESCLGVSSLQPTTFSSIAGIVAAGEQ